MYRIENIGREFTRTSQKALEGRLNSFEDEGWALDTVFAVTQRTCLIFKSETYFMVLRHAGSTRVPEEAAQ